MVDKDFDYENFFKNNPTKRPKVLGGLEERKKRVREAVKTRMTIRLDADIIEEFKKMSPEGRGYQSLINQALREWLLAREVKELVREELSDLVAQAVSSIESAVQSR
jgi:uncharacterized protein (DUF4415 family)